MLEEARKKLMLTAFDPHVPFINVVQFEMKHKGHFSLKERLEIRV